MTDENRQVMQALMQGLKENQETVKKNVDILKLKMGYKVNNCKWRKQKNVIFEIFFIF